MAVSQSRTTVTGRGGDVRWGYHSAATLSSWTVVADAAGGDLSGAVVTVDTYRVTQRPMVFVAKLSRGEWRWPVESLQIVDGTLTARLGPPE
jgi:hypothetical protein